MANEPAQPDREKLGGATRKGRWRGRLAGYATCFSGHDRGLSYEHG